VRELLALQSSDWAFMVSRGLAGPYPSQRAEGHAAALAAALDDPAAEGPRGLAPRAEPALLAAP
jgi:1,4-alpha-glucan branching enzyme